MIATIRFKGIYSVEKQQDTKEYSLLLDDSEIGVLFLPTNIGIAENAVLEIKHCQTTVEEVFVDESEGQIT